MEKLDKKEAGKVIVTLQRIKANTKAKTADPNKEKQ